MKNQNTPAIGSPVVVKFGDVMYVGTLTNLIGMSGMLSDCRVIETTQTPKQIAEFGLTVEDAASAPMRSRGFVAADEIVEIDSEIAPAVLNPAMADVAVVLTLDQAIEIASSPSFASAMAFAGGMSAEGQTGKTWRWFDKVSRAFGRLPMPVVIIAMIGALVGVYMFVAQIENAVYAALR